uniref:Putative golgi integral membrane protein 4 n=1 Tax=Panstrongylus lignarius TaxID=156445 RepID=A0A224XP85_9HEMI
MTSSRLVRGAKTRMFAFICLVSVLGALVYIFHGTQARLAEIQQQAGICSQQLESLNAQMQVILEYKLRLATTLNKEKEEHRQTKDLLEKRLKEEKEKWDKESLETKNKFEALVQKNNMLQGQLEDTKERFNEADDENKKLEIASVDLKNKIETVKKEKEEALEHLKTDVLQKQDEIKTLKKAVAELQQKTLPEDQRNNHLEKINFQLEKTLEDTKKELSDCQNKQPIAVSSPKTEAKNVGAQPDTNVAEIPKLISGLSRNFTSTPGINPMAVGDLSSVKPIAEADAAQRKLDEQVRMPSKKPTEESVLPLVQPGKFVEQGLAQIPGPPDHRTNTLQKPKINDQGNEQMSNFVAEEPEDPLLRDQQMKGQLREPFIALHGIGGVPAAMDVEGVGQQPLPAADREDEEEGGGEVNMNNQII